MTAGLQVLFEDEHCLAVLKPAGQPSQGTWAPPGETTLEQDVRRHLNPDAPELAYVGIVHRLDRPVSGVILWAKTLKAARRLSGQFEKRRVVKEYWAIVEMDDEAARPDGSKALPPPGDVWTDWLTRRTGTSGLIEVAEPESPGAREAVTRVNIDSAIRLPAGVRWLRLWPETGRTHQLRVQAAARGTPILGDAAYGAKGDFAPGIALHARALRASHPITGEPLTLSAGPPRSWEEDWGIVLDAGPGAAE